MHIWYRGSEGCPDGSTFVRRLAELGRAARLAAVGDAVDFVVTVSSAGSLSQGRLERQTREGQMAIRAVEAAQCEQVTEGLALSLDLALDPIGERASAVDPPAAGVRLGTQGTLATGAAPAALPGLAVFVEAAWPGPRSRGRLGARVSHGQGTASSVQVDVSILASRVDACPWLWNGGALAFGPCAGVELGAIWASSSHEMGRSDAGLWASGVALARITWSLTPELDVGLDAGAMVPFVRYSTGTPEGAALFRTAAVGLDLAVGVGWRLP